MAAMSSRRWARKEAIREKGIAQNKVKEMEKSKKYERGVRSSAMESEIESGMKSEKEKVE